MLPNFLCIGAQKCGTTSIWKILDAHEDVFMATPRETRFFHDDLQFSEGLQVYEYKYFADWSGQAAAGEKCPEYLYVPYVARRIRDSLGPDVKLIVTLRSPAQRALSHYRHNLTALREFRSFNEAMADEAHCLQRGDFVPVPFGYLGRGCYASQLKNYLECFDREQLLVVDFETEICSDQKALARRVYHFLDIPPILPPQLPFREGRPRLDRLQVRIDQHDADPQRHFVEVSRGPTGLQRMKSVLKRLARGHDTGRGDDCRRIFQPSEALIRFARNFGTGGSMQQRLSRQEELEINRRYFQSEIEALQPLVSFDASAWLDGDSPSEKPNDDAAPEIAA